MRSTSTCKLFMILLSVLTCAVLTRGTVEAQVTIAPVTIWITQAEINALPQSGAAWNALQFRADNPLGGVPLLADIDDEADVDTLAKALVYARTGIQAYKDAVIVNCNAAIGTEDDFPGPPQILGLSRNLLGYVIAAQLIRPWNDRDVTKYSGPGGDGFRGWLIDVRSKCINNTTLIRTHEERPNNFGTNAGASRMAADLYINTPVSRLDFASAAITFKGWLGDLTAWPFCPPGQPEPTGCNPPTGCFKYGVLSWQFDQASPRGINPLGAVISDQNGPHNVDGVLPDDLRRACSCLVCDPGMGSCCDVGGEGCFAWPLPISPLNPSPARYVYAALQGAIVQAEILHRQGYDAWCWSDKALLRAFQWLHPTFEQQGLGQIYFQAEGDDTWQPYLVNFRYGTNFQETNPAEPGKNMGFTDWTHTCHIPQSWPPPPCPGLITCAVAE